MYHVMALVERTWLHEYDQPGTEYMHMWGPYTLDWCEERIDTMNYNLDNRRNYHYFVVPDEEYQAYWKPIVDPPLTS